MIENRPAYSELEPCNIRKAPNFEETGNWVIYTDRTIIPFIPSFEEAQRIAEEEGYEVTAYDKQEEEL